MAWLDFLGPAVDIWNTERTNRSNERSVQETNQQNAENVAAANANALAIARENNAAAVAMWERQTSYNSPMEQMKRLEAAGLNPHLAYGTIAESRMATPPSLQAAEVVPAHAEANRYSYEANPVARYQQVKNTDALNKINNAEIAKREAEAIRATAEADYAQYENNKLQNSGLIKGDTPLFKMIGRGVRTAIDSVRGLGRGGNKLELYSGDAPAYGYLKGR